MSKLTELLEQHGLTTIFKPYENKAISRIDRTTYELIKQAYGLEEWKDEPHSGYSSYNKPAGREYVWFSCPEATRQEHCSHLLYHLIDGSWAYSWPGSNYVVSKQLMPIDLLHQLSAVKKAELAEACKKRSEKIKSPRDAVRLLFKELGIKHQMVSGIPRVDCGPFSIDFIAAKDGDPKVEVTFVYRAGDYKREIDLTTLSIADPDFNRKVEVIAYNGSNLKQLMLGEIQPKSFKFDKTETA